MRCVIRPLEAFSARERGLLRRWVAGMAGGSPGQCSPLELRGSSLLASADEALANDVALAAMVVLGRPFYYEIVPIGRAASRPTWQRRPERGSPASR